MVRNGCASNSEKPTSWLSDMAACQSGQRFVKHVLQDIIHGSLARHPPCDEGPEFIPMRNPHQNPEQQQNQQQSGTIGSAPDKGEKTVPYERFQAVNAAKKQAEETLAGIVAELVEDIPEEMWDIVPDLPPAAKIAWIRSATKKGLFTGKAPDQSGPDSKRPGGKPPVDFNNMSATQRMAHGYGK